MRNIAIIPARSGSKGLPDKNIADLCGKPLMAYSIEQAIESKVFDKVMVSTDSKHYSDVAQQYGAEVPFLRSEGNSGDTASSWDVVKEVLSKYEELGEAFDTACLLQPTSPLRSMEDIVDAYKIYKDKASVAVISVCEMEHSPQWSGILPQDMSLDGFIKPESGGRRQDHATYYRLNGAIYIVNVNELFSNAMFYRKGSYAYVMPNVRSVDIDTETDLKYAEFIMKYMSGM